jgi:NAD+ synthase (glutamine-hydrolysing)
LKLFIGQINPVLGDIKANTLSVINCIKQAKSDKADLVVFPEMVICGYTPQDLLLYTDFIDSCEEALEEIVKASEGIAVIVGTVRRSLKSEGKFLYDCAAIIENQQLLGYQDKSLLATYDVFNERRYFEPGDQAKIWVLKGYRIGVTICEDIWHAHSCESLPQYAINPLESFKEASLDCLVNLSASPFSLNKLEKRIEICREATNFLSCPFVQCNQVGGQDDLLYDGGSLVFSAVGNLICRMGLFKEEGYLVDLSCLESVESVYEDSKYQRLFDALVMGIKDYFTKQGFKKACIGISGGIDSAIVAVLAAKALGKENVLGVLMPSRYSSNSSLEDGWQLLKNLGVEGKQIPIEEPFVSYLDLLQQHFEEERKGIVEENLQARIRGMILMAFSNQTGAIVLNTGNKSEFALGYCTLYGDMCGGLAVLSDVTKTQVYELAKWINEGSEIIPLNTLEKPPSAELRFDQKDQDSLPPYEWIDEIIDRYVENFQPVELIAKEMDTSLEEVQKLVKLIHQNEYKRRQSPLGLRVTEKAFVVGRHFPIVQRWC